MFLNNFIRHGATDDRASFFGKTPVNEIDCGFNQSYHRMNLRNVFTHQSQWSSLKETLQPFRLCVDIFGGLRGMTCVFQCFSFSL